MYCCKLAGEDLAGPVTHFPTIKLLWTIAWLCFTIGDSCSHTCWKDLELDHSDTHLVAKQVHLYYLFERDLNACICQDKEAILKSIRDFSSELQGRVEGQEIHVPIPR
jgi:hypothetical protein